MKKTALITGASAGIGRDLATLFAQDGINVVLVARREERLNAVKTELESTFGIRAYVFSADLSKPGAAKQIFDQVSKANLHISYLINNAGFGSNGPFWELDPQREIDQIQVNVTALTHLTRLFLPAMVEAQFGRILNIASTAGFQPGPYMSTYFATKAFVISFTEGISHELKGTGVTATAHCPGATASEFAQVAGNDTTKLFTANKVASSLDVARHAYAAMNKGVPIAIHGAANAFGAFIIRFSPRTLVTSLTAKFNQP